MSNLDVTYTDHDGDTLRVTDRPRGKYAGGLCLHGREGGTYLSRADVLDLYHRLGDHLMATNNTAEAVTTPDAAADGYDWPDLSSAEGVYHCTPSVAQEAHVIVYGDRQADYGHPREDFTRTAILWTGLLQHLLADGAFIDAADVGRCMIAVKLSRDVNSPKRDNRVDMAGYAITLDRLETGQ